MNPVAAANTVQAMMPEVVHFMMRANAEDYEPGYHPTLIGRDWKLYLDGKLIDNDIGYVEGFDTRAGYLDTYGKPGEGRQISRHYGPVKAVLGPLPPDDPEGIAMFRRYQPFPDGATFGS